MPAKMRQEEVKQQEPVAKASKTKTIKKTAPAAAEPKPVARKQAKSPSPKSKSASEPKKRSASKKEEVKEAKCEFDLNIDPCLELTKKEASKEAMK
jgi:hypothetical protein